VFWSNGLVGSITTVAILLLFWPLIDRLVASFRKPDVPTAKAEA